jgi:hypothetical protein
LSSKKFAERFNIPNKTCVFGPDALFNRIGEGGFLSVRRDDANQKCPPGDEESFWMIYKGIFFGNSF